MKYSDLKKGHILSENSFFTVDEIQSNSITCLTDDGQRVKLGKGYGRMKPKLLVE